MQGRMNDEKIQIISSHFPLPNGNQHDSIGMWDGIFKPRLLSVLARAHRSLLLPARPP